MAASRQPDLSMALSRILQTRLRLVDQAVSTFDTALRDVTRGLQAETSLLLANLTPRQAARAQALVDTQVTITRQLQQLGYEDRLGEFFRSYTAVEQQALTSLSAMGLTAPNRLSRPNTRMLAQLRGVDYAYLSGLGQETVQTVARGLISNAVLGTPRARVIGEIADTLEKQFRHRAVTYADTALVSYDRVSSLATWREAGLDRFRFRGPKDIKNRPFCGKHVGKVYTWEQIQQLRNGTKLEPVWKYGGGWHCRHLWVPVAPQTETAEESPAAAPLIRPARAIEVGKHVQAVEAVNLQARAEVALRSVRSKPILAVLEQVPLQKLEFVESLWDEGSPALGLYHVQEQRIQLATQIDRHWFRQPFEPGVSYSMTATATSANAALSRALHHELAHHIQQVGGSAAEQIIVRAWQQNYSRAITRYAAQNPWEYFAESLLAWTVARQALQQQDPGGVIMVEQVLRLLDVLP